MGQLSMRNASSTASYQTSGAAKKHIEGSGWMLDHLTKTVGLHVANEVWETVGRHHFQDASGRRHGAPRIGS